MKQTVTKFTAILMILAALLSGCASGQTTGDPSQQVSTENTSAVEEAVAEETELPDNLPEKDYNGESVFVTIYSSDEQRYDMVTEDTETGEVLHDAVYRRNHAVEDRYNIVFEISETSDTNSLHASVVAQSEDFELLFYPICYGYTLANQGDFLSTDDLPYIDLEKIWWDQSLRRDLSINNKLYFMSGDISPSSMNMSACILFNKKLFDQHALAYPYDMVREGTWTMDAVSTLIDGLTVDMDGDGKISSKADSTDVFGLTGWMWSIPYGLFYGAGERFVKNNAEGVPCLDYDLDRVVSIYEKIYDIIITKQSYFAVNTAEEYENTRKVFQTDRSFLLDVKLYDMGNLRDMESDFGILPIPKYDETQNSYITFVNAASNMISVPVMVSDPEKCSILLEAMASESFKNLTPSFKTSILKGKYVRDEESSEMVDIIIRNRVFDIAYIYKIAGFENVIRLQIMANKEEVVSAIQKIHSAGETKLEELVLQFQ